MKKTKAVIAVFIACHLLMTKRREPRVWETFHRASLWDGILTRILSPVSDAAFRRTYRLSRSSFEYLCEELRYELRGQDTNMRETCPLEIRVALTLDRLCNGHTFWTLSEKYHVSQASASKFYSETIEAINRLLTPRWIRFPRTPEELRAVASTFHIRRGMCNCVGAVDGSHIKVRRPHAESLAYRNRKQYDSVVLQCIFSSDCTVLDVCVGWPGSVSDSRVWNNSPIGRQLSSVLNVPSEKVDVGGCRIGFYIVGDGGYANRTTLITPYRQDHSLTEEEKKFNFLHSSTRMPAEMGFGHLKSFFRYLTSENCAADQLQTRCDSCVAFCVLLNILIVRDGIFLDPRTRNPIFYDLTDFTESEASQHHTPVSHDDQAGGTYVRNALRDFLSVKPAAHFDE